MSLPPSNCGDEWRYLIADSCGMVGFAVTITATRALLPALLVLLLVRLALLRVRRE